MNKKVRILLWTIFLIAICVTVTIMYNTYAIFETIGEANVTIDNAKWSISLAGIDVSNGTTERIPINSFVYTANDHVENGYIAPGRNGYFDLVLDPGDTDVAIRYDITFDLDESYMDNISFDITPSEGISAVKTAIDTYSGVITLDDIESGNDITFRINVYWNNVDEDDYNSADTNIGIVKNNSISFPIDVHLAQYLGETIEEYEEGTE